MNNILVVHESMKNGDFMYKCIGITKESAEDAI